MAITRWDPWGELTALQRELDEALGWSRRRRGVRGAAILPPMDAFRTDEGTRIRVELPGMRPENVEVTVEEGLLTIRGERDTEREVSEDGWLRRERATGTFERTFALPEGVNPDDIQASFQNGLLELTVPHAPERQPRRIPIGGEEQASAQAIDVESQGSHAQGAQGEQAGQAGGATAGRGEGQ